MRAIVKYDTAPGDINQYLYNYDQIKDGGRIIINEGILDGWRVEDDYVCTFGTHITDRQRDLILKKNPHEVVMLWDSDAYWQALRESKQFEPFVGVVRTIKLPDGEDPDSLGKEAAFKLINCEEV
jgi:DNA primase